MKRRYLILTVIAAIAAPLSGYLIGLKTDLVEAPTATPHVAITSATGNAGIRPLPLPGLPEKGISARSDQPPPLPDKNAPVAKIYDSLATRAKAGDAAAAMRLFSDLQRCQGRATASTLLGTSIVADVELPATAQAEMQRRLLDRLDASDALCADLSEAQIDGRGEWLRDAALAGDAEAMVCYALSPNDFGPKFLSSAWIDWAERWHEEAPQFAAQAFAAGQADVIDLFLDGYDAGPVINDQRVTTFAFASLLAPDPELAYAYSLLNAYVLPAREIARAQNRADALRNALSAEQIARAQAFADAAMPRFAAQAGNRANIFPCRDLLHASLPW